MHALSSGAALASTSLGTTFFVLRTVGEKEGYDLAGTRIGAILQAAALIDDVVALVLLSVITALGAGDGGSEGLGWTIGRPILASVVMALLGPAVAFGPARWLWRRGGVGKVVEKGGVRAELAVAVAVLSAFLAIAFFAGTTMLLGAFLAGVFLYALPEEDSQVSFSRTYHTHIETLQTYVRSLPTLHRIHCARSHSPRRGADLLPPLLRLHRPHHPLPLPLDRPRRLAWDRLRYPHDTRQGPRGVDDPRCRRLRLAFDLLLYARYQGTSHLDGDVYEG